MTPTVSSRPSSDPPSASNQEPTGTQLATAFDGPLEPLHTTIGYLLAAVLVFLVMLLLPVVYLGVIAAAILGTGWYAVHATSMFSDVPPGRATILVGVAYIAPLIAGSLLVLFMVLPLCWRRRKFDRPMWVDRKEQPLLFAYVDKLCDTMGAPRPLRIDLIASANAAAHIDNGILGLVNRRLVLTIGLPLAQTMNLRQFTGVLAHELGHFAQGGSMRLSFAVARINRWFFRLAYSRTGIDDALNSVLAHRTHWSIVLICGISKLILSLTRLLLKLMAIASHALSMQLSRHAEFDADRQAARIVGSEPMSQALEMLPFLDTANKLAVNRAQAGWTNRALPDDLVVMTQFYNHSLPTGLKDKLTAQLLATDTHWFDTHPPIFQRIGTLKKARMTGVLKLDAPATCLFRDFDELCKLSTISLYQSALGAKLEPEHLVPTDVRKLAGIKEADLKFPKKRR